MPAPCAQRYALLRLLRKMEASSDIRLKMFEPMEGKTETEKEAIAKQLIAKLKAMTPEEKEAIRYKPKEVENYG